MLKRKAIFSLRHSVGAFNGLNDDARSTAVLLHMQHAFEMLLKSALYQKRVAVFDQMTGRSIGFEAAIRQAQQTSGIKLTNEEAGTLRAIDAMRDDEQHWYNQVDEGILYVHTRAAITLFDDLLQRVFGEHLADHLPVRVMPLSTEAPQDFELLVDREYRKIAELLQPGRRAGAEARARIRTLLAMEAHTEPETIVSDKDVTRVEKGVRAGKPRDVVFPRLTNLSASVAGAGLEVNVRFVKKGGLPVTYVSDGVDAAALRTVDLQKKFHRSASQIADRLGLTGPRSHALRIHLGIDLDPNLSHTFHFGSQHLVRYSDLALKNMQDALEHLDMEDIWLAHGSIRRSLPRPVCGQAGCAATH
ncbi:hypothetical protein HA137_17240 [Mycobacteroides chelonae]|nr:hypothetical protein [Mycobacteroides chelonae]MBF9422675.1 hypothetical protein [Mycobacteroides chelonae]